MPTNLRNIELRIQKKQLLMAAAATFWDVHFGGLKMPNAHENKSISGPKR
jgi:hypothetical protein